MELSTMTDSTDHSDENNEALSDEVAQNPGMRAAAIHSDPTISLEEARNAAAGEGPNASGSVASSSAEEYVPSESDPHPTNIPSTDHPLPEDAEDETIGASSSFSNETDERYVH
jgi:hypothetical protein